VEDEKRREAEDNHWPHTVPFDCQKRNLTHLQLQAAARGIRMPTPEEIGLRPSSCACEMTWLAAYIRLLAKWLRAVEDGDKDRATAVCHMLKRQVGRMLVHYERGPSVIRVPLLALEAAIASMTEATRFTVQTTQRGAKLNLVELQRTLQQSLRAFQRITFEALDCEDRDALLYPDDDSG
jgi:hypothetical protein